MEDKSRTNSENDSESESNESDKNTKLKCYKDWIKETEFASEQAALNYINYINIWKVCHVYKGSNAKKVVYRCSAAPYRRNECPAQIYLLFPNDKTTVTLYKTLEAHCNHMNSTRGLPRDFKKIVLQLFRDGITKPKAILAELQYRKLKLPNKAQLINYLKSLKTNTQKAEKTVTSTSNEEMSIVIKTEDLDMSNDELMVVETNSESISDLFNPININFNNKLFDEPLNVKIKSEPTTEALQSIGRYLNDPKTQISYSKNVTKALKSVEPNSKCSNSQQFNERIENFGKGIILKMQGLKKDQYLLAEKYINEILFKAEMELLT